ncbi:hypothetical protein ES703_55652 [subsurface metagenome]
MVSFIRDLPGLVPGCNRTLLVSQMEVYRPYPYRNAVFSHCPSIATYVQTAKAKNLILVLPSQKVH